MSDPAGIETATERGLRFLEKQQEADGSFLSFSSASARPFRQLRSWRTTFVPALMLASLAGLEQPAARRIRNRLAAFLLAQKDGHWAFNYWAKEAPEYHAMPYPNDLDDTFCALAALQLHDPSIVDETVLAKAVKLLLAAETRPGGPYRTWLVRPDSGEVWLDVDVAVNSNVAYFLSLNGSRLPNLESLMEQAIISGDFSSPYYPSPYAYIYYFARAYQGPRKDRLARRIKELAADTRTDLDRALCLAAGSRVGERTATEAAVRRLLAEQRRDGSWPAAAFYADPVKDGKPYYDGCPALSTAFVLEALRLHEDTRRPYEAGQARRTGPDAASRKVLATARRQSRALPGDLRLTMTRSLGKLAGSDNGREIMGLPEGFAKSLRQPFHPPSKDFLDRLGAANLHGWLAFTIYDDFIDGEGRPPLLPAANAAMRRSLDGFLEALPEDRRFQRLVRETFDTIDGANAWELRHCRFPSRNGRLKTGVLPDYGDLSKLAERSLGHSLAPWAVVKAQGGGQPALDHTRLAMKHYLIARQLHDDLHDWQEDLGNGHVTYVVARALADAGVGAGNHGIKRLMTDTGKQFWYATLPAVCGEMRRHLAASRRSLRQADVFTDDTVLDRLLAGLEASVDETLAQQSQAQKFIKEYRKGMVRT